MFRDGVTLSEDTFGRVVNQDGFEEVVRRFTWKTEGNMILQVISYGATITSIQLPDKDGNVRDVVLGFDDMRGYQKPLNPYFGATVGRVCNRIGNARFVLDGKLYKLSANKDNNQLHGGFRGFDKANWECYAVDTKVVFSYLSKDGEEGYPGSLLSQVTYEVTKDNIIKLRMTATTTKPTAVNLTNHSYFNLAGHQAGSEAMLDHVVEINTDSYTPLNEEFITTGEIKKLSELNLTGDISKPSVLRNIFPSKGFDFNFCLIKGNDILYKIAKVKHPESGRTMEMLGNQPGVQFYTSYYLPEITDKEQLIGKDGIAYNRFGAFCLEPQNYPNAVNHPSFPTSFLYPGEVYTHDVIFKFGIE